MQAKAYYETALSAFRAARFGAGVNQTIRLLAAAELAGGDVKRAQELYTEAIMLLRESNYDVIINLAGLASVARTHGQFVRAATLLGAVDTQTMTWYKGLFPKIDTFEPDIAAVRTQLGKTRFDEAWASGKAMTRTQIIDYALDDEASTATIPQYYSPADQSLTERELEILHHLAEGLNSREIAQQLVISVGTVRWYLKSIYGKLDAHSRSEAIFRAKTLNILL